MIGANAARCRSALFVVCLLVLAPRTIVAPQAPAPPPASLARGRQFGTFAASLVRMVSNRFFRFKEESDGAVWFLTAEGAAHRVRGCRPCQNRYSVCAPWWKHTVLGSESEYQIPVLTVPSEVARGGWIALAAAPFNCSMAPRYMTVSAPDLERGEDGAHEQRGEPAARPDAWSAPDALVAAHGNRLNASHDQRVAPWASGAALRRGAARVDKWRRGLVLYVILDEQRHRENVRFFLDHGVAASAPDVDWVFALARGARAREAELRALNCTVLLLDDTSSLSWERAIAFAVRRLRRGGQLAAVDAVAVASAHVRGPFLPKYATARAEAWAKDDGVARDNALWARLLFGMVTGAGARGDGAVSLVTSVLDCERDDGAAAGGGAAAAAEGADASAQLAEPQGVATTSVI